MHARPASTASRVLTTSPGRYSGADSFWVLVLISLAMAAFDKSAIQHPNMLLHLGSASTDLIPNLRRPDNQLPLLSQQIELHAEPHVQGAG